MRREFAVPRGAESPPNTDASKMLLAIVHTCGKALASAGAFVCGGSALRQFLINRARTFIFSTAMPPYLAGQIRAALVLVQQADAQRAHLNEIAALLRGGLAAHGLQAGSSTTHIVPVILGTNERALQVAAHLQANGFAAKAIRPPTVPAGTSRVRISLTSRITAQDIQRIVAIIAGAGGSLPQREVPSTVHA